MSNHKIVVEGHLLYKALSNLGKRMLQKKGVFAWGALGKNLCSQNPEAINATIGTAQAFEKDFYPGSTGENFMNCYPKEIKDFINYEKILPQNAIAYAPISGRPTLRSEWEKVLVRHSLDQDYTSNHISLPAVTGGVSHGIYLSTQLFLDEGDWIVSPNKRWENYEAILELQSGFNIQDFQLFQDGAFNVNGMVEAMEESHEKNGDKTTLILNLPNNPTGYACSTEEMSSIVGEIDSFAQKYPNDPVVVFCDDAYDQYVYVDGYPTHSMFYELLNTQDNVVPVKLDGPSKYLMMYGARVGFMTLGFQPGWFDSEESYEGLKSDWGNKVDGMIRTTVSNCNNFFQEISENMLIDGTFYETKALVLDMMTERYNKLVECFEKYSPGTGLEMDPAGGGFFVFMNVDPNVVDLGPENDTAIFAQTLHDLDQVVVLPFTEKYENNPEWDINGIRFAFCSVDIENIETAMKKICERAKAMKK